MNDAMQQSQQEEPQVTLTLKASWLNVIMAGLEEIPHKFSRPVIDSVSQQARAQLENKPQGPLSSKVIN
jgi:phage terminase large subunit-like protein